MLSTKKLLYKLLKPVGGLQGGLGEIQSVGTTEKTQHVTFPRAYLTEPTVVACMTGSSYNRRLCINNVSKTGFDVIGALLNSGTASVYYSWIAIGEIGGVIRKVLSLTCATSERRWVVC